MVEQKTETYKGRDSEAVGHLMRENKSEAQRLLEKRGNDIPDKGAISPDNIKNGGDINRSK